MSLPGRLHLGRRSSAETAEIHSRLRPGRETIPLDLYRSAAANPYLRNHRDSVLVGKRTKSKSIIFYILLGIFLTVLVCVFLAAWAHRHTLPRLPIEGSPRSGALRLPVPAQTPPHGG